MAVSDERHCARREVPQYGPEGLEPLDVEDRLVEAKQEAIVGDGERLGTDRDGGQVLVAACARQAVHGDGNTQSGVVVKSYTHAPCHLHVDEVLGGAGVEQRYQPCPVHHDLDQHGVTRGWLNACEGMQQNNRCRDRLLRLRLVLIEITSMMKSCLHSLRWPCMNLSWQWKQRPLMR
jgi:hypothetical protein